MNAPSNRTILIAGAVLSVPAVLLIAEGVARGSLMRDAAIAAILIGPLAIVISLVRPLAIPYAAYIALLPFDMFLSVSRAGTLTKILGLASGLLLLFFCLRTRRLVPPKFPLYALTALVAWNATTLLWTVEPATAVEPLQTLLGLVLLYGALSVVPIARSDFTIILTAVVVGYLVAACYGIATFHGVFSSAMFNASSPDRLILAMGNHYIDPNEFADSMIFPLTVALMLGLRSGYLTLKLLFAAAAGAMLMAIVLSGSREAILTFVAIIAYYAWRSRYRLQVLVFTMLMALIAAPFFGSLSNRFQTALTTGGAGRTSIWSVGFEAAKHYGIFGSGIGSFPLVYNRFYLSVPQTYLYGWSAPAHNVLLRHLVELGVIGLALLVLFIAAHFVILRTIQRDHPLYDFRIMMEVSLIGICISSLFIDAFHGKWTWLVFATTVQLVNLAASHKRATWNPSTPPEFVAEQLSAPPLRPAPVMPPSQ